MYKFTKIFKIRTPLLVVLIVLPNSSLLMANNTISSSISSIFSNNYGKIAAAAALATASLYTYFKASYTWHTESSDGYNAGGYRVCTYSFNSIAFRQSTAFAAIQKAHNKVITNLDGKEWGYQIGISKGTPIAPYPNPYWPLSYVTRSYRLNGDKKHDPDITIKLP